MFYVPFAFRVSGIFFTILKKKSAYTIFFCSVISQTLNIVYLLLLSVAYVVVQIKCVDVCANNKYICNPISITFVWSRLPKEEKKTVINTTLCSKSCRIHKMCVFRVNCFNIHADLEYMHMTLDIVQSKKSIEHRSESLHMHKNDFFFFFSIYF